MITLIAAVTADKYALGRKGNLLYRISPDMRHFKDTTMGHPIVMGRKTFESFPTGALPGRRNIVVSRRGLEHTEGVEVYPTPEEALAAAGTDGKEIFVIGGGEIYRHCFPVANRLVLTEIDAPTPEDADTFFPEIDKSEWRMQSDSGRLTDPKSGVNYRFICLSRI